MFCDTNSNIVARYVLTLVLSVCICKLFGEVFGEIKTNVLYITYNFIGPLIIEEEYCIQQNKKIYREKKVDAVNFYDATLHERFS